MGRVGKIPRPFFFSLWAAHFVLRNLSGRSFPNSTRHLFEGWKHENIFGVYSFDE